MVVSPGALRWFNIKRVIMTKTALLFPGQGSQSVGMLGDLSNDFALIKETFSEASSVLDYDLWELVQQNQLIQTWECHISYLNNMVRLLI